VSYACLPWTLSLVTAPTVEPVALEDAKLQVRETVDDNDALIQSLIVAARQHVESFTGRALIDQTWDLQQDGFPGARSIWLPKAPLRSIASVSYRDQDGTVQTWSSTNYTVDAPVGPAAQTGRISPNFGVIYPTTQWVPNAVVIRFVAGYGATAATVPEAIKAAMKLLIGHWYATREAVTFGTAGTEIPMAVSALLWPYKVF
jgi:uncharacterized phiE125 gp8 family phage protein